MASSASDAPPESPTEQQRDLGSPFQQWYMVGVLTLLFTLSFIDRSALNIVVEPIRQDLQITDVQMSVLIGFSFVSMYIVMSIPAGYIADLVSRRAMVGAAVTFWSSAAILCGAASNYWQLFAGRAALGAGEAAFPPAAYSMMKDGVDPRGRARAFAFINRASIWVMALGPLLEAAYLRSQPLGSSRIFLCLAL
ncbi:MAG: MFS transporter [Terricaulis sp.]